MIEMHTIKNGLNPPFMREIFCEHYNPYNLRNSGNFSFPKIKTVTYDSENIRFRGPQIWAIIPQSIKKFNILLSLKAKSNLGLETPANVDHVGLLSLN